MQLTFGLSNAMSEAQGRAFDKRAATHLALRHPDRCAADADMAAWAGAWRRWLAPRGVGAEQHIVDHLEIILVHGADVVRHPDYLRAMQAPLLSSEEKSVRLRRIFLPEVSDG